MDALVNWPACVIVTGNLSHPVASHRDSSVSVIIVHVLLGSAGVLHSFVIQITVLSDVQVSAVAVLAIPNNVKAISFLDRCFFSMALSGK